MSLRFENPVPAFELTLPDELLLLALRESGSVKNKQNVGFALSGAALLELVLRERLRVDGKSVLLLDATPVGHPACDEVLGRIAADPKARSLGHWIRKQQGKLFDLTAESLVRAELVQRAAGPMGLKRYPELPNHEEPAIVRRITDVMLGRQPDDRSAVLAQLLQIADLLKGIVVQPMGERHARLKELAAHDFGIPGVTESVRQTQRELSAMQAAAGAAV